MKDLKYILFALLPLFALYSCEDDDGKNPSFGDEDVPHIYVDWQENRAAKVGDIVDIPLQVSPSDGATYEWTLDGVVISKERDLKYPITENMVRELKFVVTRNGIQNSRTANLLVPDKFKPKTSVKKSVAFLSLNGKISDVNWENTTHLVVSSIVVDKGGVLRSADLEKKIDLPTIIAYAHHYGVYTILDFSGELNSYLTAAPVYGSYTFYDAAIDASIRANLIRSIVDKAKAHGFDGINIYMDKANTSNGEFGDTESLVKFYNELAAAVPAKVAIEGNDYDYLLTMSVVGGWTRGSLAKMVNIPRYNWVNILAFGAEDLDAVPHSSVASATTEVNTWTGWLANLSPKRAVLVLPAFGLRYFGTPNEYTWANLGQYTQYMTYKSISTTYPDAPSKDVVVITENGGDKSKEVNKIFYDGFTAVDQKAELAKAKDLGGLGLWSVESDTKEASKSLMLRMNKALGN